MRKLLFLLSFVVGSAFGQSALTISNTVTKTSGVHTFNAGTISHSVADLTGLGTGVLTWITTPSSANLAAAVTGETGTGALVFATSPTLVTPVLGAATATSLTTGSLTNSGLTAGRIPYASTAGLLADSSNFVWDNTNQRVGIGHSSPQAEIDITKSVNGIIYYRIWNQNAGAAAAAASYWYNNTPTESSIIHTGSAYTPSGILTANTFRVQTNGVRMLFDKAAGGEIMFAHTGTEQARITTVGVGVKTSTAPTAYLHLGAGTTAASTAPLKFTSGSLQTTAEAGAVEFLTDKYYGTITTGAARKELTLNDAALTSGRIPVGTTNGRLIDDASLSFDIANQRLNLGVAASTANRDVFLEKSVDGIVRYYTSNTSTGAAAQTGFTALASSSAAVSLWARSSGFTTSGLTVANSAALQNTVGPLIIGTLTAAQPLIFHSGGTATTDEGLRIVSGMAITKEYTVATLPTCNAAARGGRAHVTDATAPTFLATLAGGGAVVTPAFCDGTNWVAG